MINAGKSVMKGLELEAGVKRVEGLTLKAQYTYLDTELKSINPPDLSTNPLFASFAGASLSAWRAGKAVT